MRITLLFLETGEKLIQHVENEYLKTPYTKEDGKSRSLEFPEKWQFQNALGAVDGKNVVMNLPPNSGSQEYNFALLAIGGPNNNGRMDDSGYWKRGNGISSTINVALWLRKITVRYFELWHLRVKKLLVETVSITQSKIRKANLQLSKQLCKEYLKKPVWNYYRSMKNLHTSMHLSPERAVSITMSALLFITICLL